MPYKKPWISRQNSRIKSIKEKVIRWLFKVEIRVWKGVWS